MLEIREEQLEAMRACVRAATPDAVLGDLRGQGIEAQRDNGSVVATGRDGARTQIFFHGDGSTDRLVLPTGQSYRLDNDASGRLHALEHSGGASVEVDRDAEGRVTALRRVEGRGTDEATVAEEHGFRYDDQCLSAVRYPDATTKHFEHDGEKRLVAQIDRTGARTEYVRDDEGVLVAARDPLGRVTEFDSKGGALQAVVFPDGSREEYGYDADRSCGIVTRRDGSDVYQQLGDDGAVRVITWPDGSWNAFDTDEVGNLCSARNANGWVGFVSDADGNTIKEKTPDGVVQLGYDPEGRLTKMRTPAGDDIAYGWDEDGRLSWIRDWEGRTQRFQYTERGTVGAIKYGNGLVEKQRYANTGRLAHAHVVNDKRTTSEQRYGYDVCGRLSEIEDVHASEGWQLTLSHDAEGRLTRVVDGSRQLVERFEHDAKGNLIRDGGDDISVNELDAPVRHGEHEISYDALGNMTSLPGPHGVIHCSYAADGSLQQARVGESSWRYEYDALGRRTLKTDGVRSWRYGWVGHQMLWEEFRETPDARGIRRDYLWVPDSVVPIAFREGGRTYWLQCDARGAPIRAFRSDGTVAWRARYDAFGRAHEEIANVRQPWRLPGQYHDEETGLHYSVCRYYSPHIKSYLTRDPLWYEPGAANYGYSRNDPYNYCDPFGGPFFLLAAVAAVAVGAVVGAVVAAATGGDPIAGAVDGAVSVVGGIVGGIVGGMVGGPVGMVAGAMVGSTAGAAAGSLVENARRGEPLCLKCAAKAAGVALVIDVALLGLGKIPGVKRAARALGKKLASKGNAVKNWARTTASKVRAQTEGRLRYPGMVKKGKVARAEIDATAEQIASEIPGATAATGVPIKGKKRTLEKAGQKYGGDVGELTDYARNTIVVPSGQEGKALARLQELNPDITDVKVIKPGDDPLGYTGMNIKQPTSNGMIGETQINTPEMIYAKEKPDDARHILGEAKYEELANKPGMPEGGLGHKYYEDYRSLPPGDPARDGIAAESKVYYEAVRKIGGGG